MTMWLVAGAILLILLNLPDGVTDSIKSNLREGISPLQELLTSTSRRVTETTKSIQTMGELLEENRRYQEDLVTLRARIRMLGDLEQENERLREQLQFVEREPAERVAAEVIGRDISGWWQTLRINKGQYDGVTEDRAVLTPKGVVGRTDDVSLRTADVLLLTDPNCRVSAILPRVNGYGVVSGRGVPWSGSILLEMTFINRNLPIEVGDEVETSGLGGVFPRGLRIGQVHRIEVPDAGLHQVVEIRPSADFGAIQTVLVDIQGEDAAEALLLRRTLQQEAPAP